jgi:hypothetical protein
VGFDLHRPGGRLHFFGNHPRPLRNEERFQVGIRNFEIAASDIPPHVEIVNATPGSALKCFPMMSLAEALEFGDRSK